MRSLGWVLIQYDRCPYKMEGIWTHMQREEMPCEDADTQGRMPRDYGGRHRRGTWAKDCQPQPGAWRREGTIPPKGLSRECGSAHTLILDSSLQNGEATCFGCFQPPRLYLVPAALGSSYTQEATGEFEVKEGVLKEESDSKGSLGYKMNMSKLEKARDGAGKWSRRLWEQPLGELWGIAEGSWHGQLPDTYSWHEAWRAGLGRETVLFTGTPQTWAHVFTFSTNMWSADPNWSLQVMLELFYHFTLCVVSVWLVIAFYIMKNLLQNDKA